MKKYLFIVLLVGVVLGQAVPDTLIMKTGQKFLGYYDSKDNTYTQFKHQNSTKIDRILNSVIQEVRLGDKSKAVKVLKTPSIQKDSDVSVHLKSAGKHFNNFFERSMYALGFGSVGALVAIAVDPSLSIIFSLAGLYNNVIAIFEINNAGKELIKASKTMRIIEQDLSKKKPK